MQQHELALKVNAWKRIERSSNQALAQAVGINAETVARYLRGEATIPLAVFNHLANLVGLQVTVTLGPSGATSLPVRSTSTCPCRSIECERHEPTREQTWLRQNG